MNTGASRGPDWVSDDIKFGAYRLSQDGVLTCPDKSHVQLAGRLHVLLRILIACQGQVVSRAELIQGCWYEQTVADENLTRAIADLRKALARGGGAHIETVYGQGYRLTVDIGSAETLMADSFCEEAHHRTQQRQPGALDSAEALLQQVLTTQPEHLPSLLALAELQVHRMQLGYGCGVDLAPTAVDALQRALVIDRRCADALGFYGMLAVWVDRNLDRARDLLSRARALASHAYTPNQATAWLYLAQADFRQAGDYFARAIDAKPASMTARAGLAFSRMYAGRESAALQIARDMQRIDASGAVSQILAAFFEAEVGDSQAAVDLARRGFSALPDSPVAGAIYANALARSGRHVDARGILRQHTSLNAEVGSCAMAAPAWFALGELRRAREALEQGDRAGCPWLPTVIADPRKAYPYPDARMAV